MDRLHETWYHRTRGGFLPTEWKQEALTELHHWNTAWGFFTVTLISTTSVFFQRSMVLDLPCLAFQRHDRPQQRRLLSQGRHHEFSSRPGHSKRHGANIKTMPVGLETRVEMYKTHRVENVHPSCCKTVSSHIKDGVSK